MVAGTFVQGFNTVWSVVLTSETAGYVVGVLSVVAVVFIIGSMVYLAGIVTTLLRRAIKN